MASKRRNMLGRRKMVAHRVGTRCVAWCRISLMTSYPWRLLIDSPQLKPLDRFPSCKWKPLQPSSAEHYGRKYETSLPHLYLCIPTHLAKAPSLRIGVAFSVDFESRIKLKNKGRCDAKLWRTAISGGAETGASASNFYDPAARRAPQTYPVGCIEEDVVTPTTEHSPIPHGDRFSSAVLWGESVIVGWVTVAKGSKYSVDKVEGSSDANVTISGHDFHSDMVEATLLIVNVTWTRSGSLALPHDLKIIVSVITPQPVYIVNKVAEKCHPLCVVEKGTMFWSNVQFRGLHLKTCTAKVVVFQPKVFDKKEHETKTF
ncbi:hypothetical protein AAG570_006058 [Ranatra chinensis]|uniref:Uncharacterized protein n=1 Tax=Ranatra chinensis TaxID=642074 RepID=A0ABD0YBY8_9HEMI